MLTLNVNEVVICIFQLSVEIRRFNEIKLRSGYIVNNEVNNYTTKY